jgi:hypothetical protein
MIFKEEIWFNEVLGNVAVEMPEREEAGER